MSSGRRWLELRIRAPKDPDGAGELADLLVESGARGVIEEEGILVAYLPEPEDPPATVQHLRDSIDERLGPPGLEVSWRWQEHEDWAETWKRGLGPRRLGERIVVHPSWTEPETGPDDVVVVLDPGMAFGTAEHGTTRGCLRLLEQAVRPGDRVLDVGAGSGILSVAAAKLGAEAVQAVEGDVLACEALLENVERNGVAAAVTVEERWLSADDLDGGAPWDGVVANLETPLLLPLFPGLAVSVAPGGWLIVSGILEEEWSQVAVRLTDLGFRLERVDEDGRWRSGLLRR